jgi:hypothetical protein
MRERGNIIKTRHRGSPSLPVHFVDLSSSQFSAKHLNKKQNQFVKKQREERYQIWIWCALSNGSLLNFIHTRETNYLPFMGTFFFW